LERLIRTYVKVPSICVLAAIRT